MKRRGKELEMRDLNRISLILLTWYLVTGVIMSILWVTTLSIYSPASLNDFLTASSWRWGELAPVVNITKIIIVWPTYYALVLILIQNLLTDVSSTDYHMLVSVEAIISPVISSLLVIGFFFHFYPSSTS